MKASIRAFLAALGAAALLAACGAASLFVACATGTEPRTELLAALRGGGHVIHLRRLGDGEAAISLPGPAGPTPAGRLAPAHRPLLSSSPQGNP
jgi:hypothetical protein